MARGLELIGVLATKWMADPALAEIVRIARIHPAWVARLDAAAETLRAAARAQTSRMTARVEQGDLDVLDGRLVHLLKLVVDLFDEAHEEDPTIPRLVPITIARALGRRKPRKGEEEAIDDGATDPQLPPEMGEEEPAAPVV